MSDIEQGLKEAIESAQARDPLRLGGERWSDDQGKTLRGRNIVRGDIASGERLYAHANGALPQGTLSLTAPQVINTLDTLTKSTAVLEGLAFDLSNELAGHEDYAGAKETVSPNQESLTVFDRMGMRLLELTRTLESIEREVKRSLGAVKP